MGTKQDAGGSQIASTPDGDSHGSKTRYAYIARSTEGRTGRDIRPDVQEMIQRLGEYNLGVFMPHSHDCEGRFDVLPPDCVQVEDGLRVTFKPRSLASEQRCIPVGWMWLKSGVSAGAVCVAQCTLVNTPSGEFHRTDHYKS